MANRIQEGILKKGGYNDIPTVSRPATPPPAQTVNPTPSPQPQNQPQSPSTPHQPQSSENSE